MKILNIKNINFIKFSSLQYVSIIISFGLNFFLAKNTSQEDYGIYSLGLLLFNTIIAVKDYGLERNSLVRLNLAKLNSNLREEYSSQFIVRLLTLIFLVILGTFYIIFNDLGFYLYFYLLAAFFLSITPKFFFDFNNFFIKESFLSIFDRLIILFLLISLYVYENFDIFYISLSYFISRLFYFILTISDLRNWIGYKFIKQNIIKNILSYNFLFWLTSVFNIILLNINQLVLTSKGGVLDLAVFSFALQFISILKILQNQFLRWKIPDLSKMISQHSLSIAKINKVLFRAFLFSAVFSSIIYFIASIVINNYFLEYKASLEVLLILCVWSIFYGPGLINSYILSNKIKPSIFFIVSVFFTSVSLFMNVLFEIDYILTAYIIVIPHTVSMFVQYYLTYKNYAEN